MMYVCVPTTEEADAEQAKGTQGIAMGNDLYQLRDDGYHLVKDDNPTLEVNPVGWIEARAMGLI